MDELDDIFRVRLDKLQRLRAAGKDPYPSRFRRTHLSADVLAGFERNPGEGVRVAGRIVTPIRRIGRLSFAHILDQAGRIQVSFSPDGLGEEGYSAFLRLFDTGDFIGVDGTTWRTRRGEVTVKAESVVMLAKSLRSLPEKWHGLVDVETRYRKRYLDLISNEDVRRVFVLRSQIVAAVREFLNGRGFQEVETPVLVPVPGGGAARPFRTYYQALDATLYMRVALELYLKRCIIGGLERVYEIGKNFRNEGMDRTHNPEFTMLEAYQAYADYQDMMDLTEQMVAHVAMATVGTTRVQHGGQTIDLAPPWRRLSLREAIREFAGVDYGKHPDLLSLRQAAEAAGLKVRGEWNRGKLLDELVTAFVEPRLIQPTFLIDYPVDFPGSVLAKRKPDNPEEVERFEAFVAGFEIANSFSELNDPLDQRRRFEEQARLLAAGDEEAQPMDVEFLEALEYAMPPTGGLGVGIDRLVMLLVDRRHIREVILFPQLRPRA